MHELIHALGRWHEQSRPDRNSYVEVQEENIKEGKLVCACACACARPCACACACACACVCVCMKLKGPLCACMRACVRMCVSYVDSTVKSSIGSERVWETPTLVVNFGSDLMIARYVVWSTINF